MPRMTGLQAAREIKAQSPDTSVLLLSMHDDERYFYDALKAGASGYVLKRAADAELIEAVAPWPAAGRSSRRPARAPRSGSSAEGPRDPLTPRELDVVKLIAEAYTNKQIAEILKVSEKTVESHRATCCRSSGCATAWSSCATRSAAA